MRIASRQHKETGDRRVLSPIEVLLELFHTAHWWRLGRNGMFFQDRMHGWHQAYVEHRRRHSQQCTIMFSQQTINKESKKLVALHYCCGNINNIDCASHLRHVERHLNVTHGTKIVNFIRFDISNNGDEVRGVTKIAVMKE